MIIARDKVNAFLDMIDSGCIDARDVLGNVLVNFMSNDEAEEFIDSEYSEYFDDSEDDEDNEWEENAEFYSTEDEELNI